MENKTLEKTEIIKQTRSAFEFLNQLYRETSYLIKEVAGLLSEGEQEFVIGRPSGYGISTRTSTGLESNNVGMWGVRKLAVFFVPKAMTKLEGGQTITPFAKNLKVIYLRIVFNEPEIKEPYLYYGVIRNILSKAQRATKFENLMGHIEYNDDKIFRNYQNIEYEDGSFSFSANLQRLHLFDIDSAEEVAKKVVQPAVNLFQKV
jgi:hypothetical protein